jgi:hypothetical protein
LLSFGYNLYIHEYLVKEELILGASTKGHIKECCEDLGINRKTAKQLYLHGANYKKAKNNQEETKLKSIHKYLKNDFDTNIWPVE